MESRNPKLHRSDIDLNMPPRWGFSLFGVGGYNDVAPTELKDGRSASRLNSDGTALLPLKGTNALYPCTARSEGTREESVGDSPRGRGRAFFATELFRLIVAHCSILQSGGWKPLKPAGKDARLTTPRFASAFRSIDANLGRRT